MGPFDILVEILAPNTRILADENKLANAAGNERLGLLDNRYGSPLMVASANIGNGAEAAEAVAAIGNLQISDGTFNRAFNGGKHRRS